MILILCSLTSINIAQEINIKKSFGIQTGLSGVWINYEARLAKRITLNSEIGFDYGVWNSSWSGMNENLLVPVFSLEPRMYFELFKDQSKTENIDFSRLYYISLITNYHPDWFAISDYDYLKIVSDLSIIPSCGLKQSIGKHFYGEAGVGVHYKYLFGKKAGFLENDSDILFNLHLRLGFRF